MKVSVPVPLMISPPSVPDEIEEEMSAGIVEETPSARRIVPPFAPTLTASLALFGMASALLVVSFSVPPSKVTVPPVPLPTAILWVAKVPPFNSTIPLAPVTDTTVFAIPNLSAVIVPPVCSKYPVQFFPYPTSNDFAQLSVPPSNTNVPLVPVKLLC